MNLLKIKTLMKYDIIILLYQSLAIASRKICTKMNVLIVDGRCLTALTKCCNIKNKF